MTLKEIVHKGDIFGLSEMKQDLCEMMQTKAGIPEALQQSRHLKNAVEKHL